MLQKSQFNIAYNVKQTNNECFLNFLLLRADCAAVTMGLNFLTFFMKTKLLLTQLTIIFCQTGVNSLVVDSQIRCTAEHFQQQGSVSRKKWECACRNMSQRRTEWLTNVFWVFFLFVFWAVVQQSVRFEYWSHLSVSTHRRFYLICLLASLYICWWSGK